MALIGIHIRVARVSNRTTGNTLPDTDHSLALVALIGIYKEEPFTRFTDWSPGIRCSSDPALGLSWQPGS